MNDATDYSPEALLDGIRREIDAVIAENLQLKEELYTLRLEERELRQEVAAWRGA